ncbi:MAG: ATP-binding protein [Magnetococcus sp. YQC-3]
MSDAKPLILLLDDDLPFRERAMASLTLAGLEVLAPELRPGPVLAALERRPQAILADQNMGNMAAITFFNRMRDQHHADWSIAPIWMVTGLDKLPLDDLLQTYPNVQPQVLRKPVAASDILAVMGQETTRFKLPTELTRLPFPLRVLDSQGQVVYRSPGWGEQAINRPASSHFLPFSEDQVPNPYEFFVSQPLSAKNNGELTGTKAHSGLFYRLHSFPILKGRYLAQLAEPLRTEDEKYKWEYLVDKLFITMKDAGFPRGRFYRLMEIPNSDGMLRLEMASGGLCPGWTLPIEYPLSQALHGRFNGFATQNMRGNRELIYQIRQKQEDPVDDPAILFWNGVVDAIKLESWVEVPLLFKLPSPQEFITSGLFVFDRLGAEGLWDGKPGEVTENHVVPVKATLFYMVRQIAQALQLDAQERDRKRLLALTKLDQILFREVHRDVIEKNLLQAAVEITGAAGGLLITREGAAETLGVRATLGEVQAACLEKASFLLSEVHHPVVQCWQRGEAVFLPHYKGSAAQKAILAGVNVSRLATGQPDRLHAWLEHGIGSLAAMPILSGDEKVGAISLQHAEPYHFRREQIQALDRLLQRTRWFLHAAHREDERTHWERAMIHEVRSEATPILHGVDQLVNGIGEPDAAQAKIQRCALRLYDLTENFLETQHAPDHHESFTSPGESLWEFLDLSAEVRTECNFTLLVDPETREDPVWQTCLRGDAHRFARVVRNLLDNAQKFCTKGGTITLQAQVETTMWRLSLTNSGQMLPDAEQHKFQVGYQENQKQRSGAHVGLASSLGVVRAVGGDIILNNGCDVTGQPIVRTLLCWPLPPVND